MIAMIAGERITNSEERIMEQAKSYYHSEHCRDFVRNIYLSIKIDILQIIYTHCNISYRNAWYHPCHPVSSLFH